MTPGTQSEIIEFDHMRNRNQAIRGSKTIEQNNISNENHLKLIHKLQDDKVMRKKREAERRTKTLEKYVKQVEEKQKVDQEVKDRLAEDKQQRHKAALEKILQKGEDRKAMIADQSKALKEVKQAKPLHLKYQERYEQEIESKELALQKKALEDKRNFVN